MFFDKKCVKKCDKKCVKKLDIKCDMLYIIVMEENKMRTKLNWNEEFSISFENEKGTKFSTPSGKGFISKISADSEVERLKRSGFKNIKVFIRVWN